MNRIEQRHQQHTASARRPGSEPARWHIGNASVSTEELRAWQLGPARVDYWVAIDGTPRRVEG